MADERIRSLLLIETDADERRLISAVAARSGWTVVGAADGETAVGLLQGPHGREVQAALLGAWNGQHSPELIASLRAHRDNLPLIVLSHGGSVDIPALTRHLLTRFSEQTSIRPLSIGNDALAVLMRYGWPGNVRQLAGVLFRAALQCEDSSMTAEHFPHIAVQSRFSGRRTDFAPTLSKSRSDAAIAGAPAVTLFTGEGHLRPLEEIEADLIRLAIAHYRGRMTDVARRLGIGRSPVDRKLGDFGIDPAA
jgi:DNA-binding NtrC family response regulator